MAHVTLHLFGSWLWCCIRIRILHAKVLCLSQESESFQPVPYIIDNSQEFNLARAPFLKVISDHQVYLKAISFYLNQPFILWHMQFK